MSREACTVRNVHQRLMDPKCELLPLYVRDDLGMRHNHQPPFSRKLRFVALRRVMLLTGHMICWFVDFHCEATSLVAILVLENILIVSDGEHEDTLL